MIGAKSSPRDDAHASQGHLLPRRAGSAGDGCGRGLQARVGSYLLGRRGRRDLVSRPGRGPSSFPVWAQCPTASRTLTSCCRNSGCSDAVSMSRRGPEQPVNVPAADVRRAGHARTAHRTWRVGKRRGPPAGSRRVPAPVPGPSRCRGYGHRMIREVGLLADVPRYASAQVPQYLLHDVDSHRRRHQDSCRPRRPFERADDAWLRGHGRQEEAGRAASTRGRRIVRT